MNDLNRVAAALIIFSAAASSCTTGTNRSGGPREDTFERLEHGFADPGKEYGSAPLWVWNTEVDTAIIDKQ